MKRFKLSNPVTKEELEEAYKEGLLRKEDLEDGAYYAGRCRNARVARWDAKTQKFTYMRTKFGSSFPETIRHPADDNGYDLFTPEAKVEPTEDERISS